MILQSYELLTTLGFLGCAFLIFIFTSMDLILLIHMENLWFVSCLSDKGNCFSFPLTFFFIHITFTPSSMKKHLLLRFRYLAKKWNKIILSYICKLQTLVCYQKVHTLTRSPGSPCLVFLQGGRATCNSFPLQRSPLIFPTTSECFLPEWVPEAKRPHQEVAFGASKLCTLEMDLPPLPPMWEWAVVKMSHQRAVILCGKY